MKNETMKKFIKDNKTIITVVAILILFTGGQFAIADYNNKAELTRIEAQKEKELSIIRTKQTQEKLAEFRKQLNIDDCVADAHDIYIQNWNNRCVTRGKEANCKLYTSDSNKLNKAHEAEKDRCYDRY